MQTSVTENPASSTTVLRGITWDHPRAVDSIERASEAFQTEHPELRLDWDARPLHEFEDVPLQLLAADYDLLAIDHPFIGDAVASGALAPLSSLVPPTALDFSGARFVGHSLESYEWRGEYYALPVDAACMVGAARADALTERDHPRRWAQVVELLQELGPERTLLTANPTHLWGTFLSLCEAHRPGRQPDFESGPAWWTAEGIAAEVGVPALELLRELTALTAPRSFQLDPVQVLDELSGDGAAVYCPSVFIYSTYAHDRPGRARVAFHDAPSLDGEPVGTLTGGVGLGVSRTSRAPEDAARFVAFATSDAVQRGVYAGAGGQPATVSAWHDERVNAAAGGLYRATSNTMQRSFVRPRRRGYPAYQRAAARTIHELVRADTGAPDILRALNRLWADVAS